MEAFPSLMKCRLCFTILGVALSLAPPLHAATFSVSPNTVSNSYAGYVTLQVTGIAAGHAVQVQKYFDANTDGIIDAGDVLRQQYTLTDGMAGQVLGGVTNVNVPGDNDTTAGQITAQWNFATDNSQSIIGKYLFRCSSLSGDFATPFTNSFTVTNAAYFPSCTMTGNVVNAGTNVPNALVLLFQPIGTDLNFVSGTTANNAGAYSIKMPPGTYTLLAVKSNFLANSTSAPALTLTSGQTVTTNLTLTSASQTISGKIVDAANSSLGLPGLVLPVFSVTNVWFTLVFTDTNGNFTIGTRPDQWQILKNETSLGAYGYLATHGSPKINTSTGSVSGVTISYPKATALFYGVVTNFLGTPFPGVGVIAGDNNGLYDSATWTDVNGYYTVGALCNAATNWQVHISDVTLSVLTNNIFSLPPVDLNAGTNLSCGPTASAEADFSVIYATNHVTGWVRDDGGNPLPNIQLYAVTTFGTVTYITQTTTDASGNYWLNLGNGTWTVYVNCCQCTNCGPCLSTLTYTCPSSQMVTITSNNTNAYFTAVRCGTLGITSPSMLPDGGVNIPYSFQFTNTGCNVPFTWSACSALPGGLSLTGSGSLYGNPTTAGSNYFCVQVTDFGGFGNTVVSNFSLFVGQFQITNPSLFNGGVGSGYTNQLVAAYGYPPYGWTLNSGSLPPGVGLSSAGVLNGIPTASGTFTFNVRVDDSDFHATNRTFSLLINPKPSAPPFRWAVKAGGTGIDQAFSVGVDSSGKAYLAGDFYSPTLTFGAVTLTNKGNGDVFLAKYDNAGNVIGAVSFGAEGDDQLRGSATDASGNNYLSGWFSSTNLAFGATTLTNASTTNDCFVAKLDKNGNVLWAKRAGGTNDDIATRIAADTNGNCCVVGYFSSPTIAFGSFTLTNVATDGSSDMFVTKYDTSGNVLWARSAGGPGFDIANAVAVDGSGNVYITGQFDGTNFNLSGTTLTNLGPSGTSDMFLAKYNSAGALQWVKQAGGNDSEVAFLAADGPGNTYLAGYFVSGVLNFVGAGTSLTNSSLDGSESFFVAKYNSAGALQWAHSAVGDSYDDGRGIAVDAAGNSYVAGFFGSDSITFGNATLMNYAGAGGPAEVFVVKYDPAGNVLWAKRAGGSKADQGIRPALDPSGNLYLAGHFKSSNAQFDSTTLASSGNFDVFLALIDGSGPTLTIKLSGAQQALLQWPTNRPGYQLQSESTLTNPPAWSTVTNPVGIVGDQNTVTNATSGAAKFYRLRSQ